MKLLFDKGDILEKKNGNLYKYMLVLGSNKDELDITKELSWYGPNKLFFLSIKDLLEDYVINSASIGSLSLIVSTFESDMQLNVESVKRFFYKKPLFKTCKVVKRKKFTKYVPVQQKDFILRNVLGCKVIGKVDDMKEMDKYYLKTVFTMPNTILKPKLSTVQETITKYERGMKQRRDFYYKNNFNHFFDKVREQFNDFYSTSIDSKDYVVIESDSMYIKETKRNGCTYYSLYITFYDDLYIKIGTISENSCDHDKCYFYCLALSIIDIRNEMYVPVRRGFDKLEKGGNLYRISDLTVDTFDINNENFGFTYEENLMMHEKYSQI